MTWYNASWLYRKKATINASCIGANQTNFIVLYRISGIGNKSLANGTDIIFTDSDETTRLNHDLISFAGYTGNAWIKIPSITDNTAKDIYMYYGNTTGGDQTAIAGYKPSSTWSDYQFVCHMHDAANNQTLTDSSKYQLPLWKGDDSVASPGAPVMKTCFIGSCQTWRGSDDYISSNRVSQFQFTSQLSIEVIVSGSFYETQYGTVITWHNRPNDTNHRIARLYYRQASNWMLYTLSGTRLKTPAGVGDNFYWWPSANFSPNTRMSVLGLVYKSGVEETMYNAGKLMVTDVTPGTYGNLAESNYGILLGNPTSFDSYYSGSILEVRTTKRILDVDWYATSYINASSLACKKNYIFYTIGQEEGYEAPSTSDWSTYNTFRGSVTGWTMITGQYGVSQTKIATSATPSTWVIGNVQNSSNVFHMVGNVTGWRWLSGSSTLT